MSKIFKPRRGKASTMNGTKSSTVLAAGEMFIELPDTGVGTGICKMKMGDGVTAYSSLPYAMGGDIASTEITGSITEDTSTTATAALANVTTGRTLGAIIGSLRKACQLNASAIATLNDENGPIGKLNKITGMNGDSFILNYGSSDIKDVLSIAVDSLDNDDTLHFGIIRATYTHYCIAQKSANIDYASGLVFGHNNEKILYQIKTVGTWRAIREI